MTTRAITVSKAELMKCIREARVIVEQWPEWRNRIAFEKFRPSRAQPRRQND